MLTSLSPTVSTVSIIPPQVSGENGVHVEGSSVIRGQGLFSWSLLLRARIHEVLFRHKHRRWCHDKDGHILVIPVPSSYRSENSFKYAVSSTLR